MKEMIFKINCENSKMNLVYVVIILCLFDCYICLCCCLARTNPKQEIFEV